MGTGKSLHGRSICSMDQFGDLPEYPRHGTPCRLVLLDGAWFFLK
jgi:hypothetical protein